MKQETEVVGWFSSDVEGRRRIVRDPGESIFSGIDLYNLLPGEVVDDLMDHPSEIPSAPSSRKVTQRKWRFHITVEAEPAS